MNLHEECLLKYLLNPMELTLSTEMLKINNEAIFKEIASKTLPLVKTGELNYTAYRV